MKIEYVDYQGFKLAILDSDRIVIHETQDALDFIAEASYQESSRVIVYEEQLVPSFFELKSGLAGDILQKFSTYRMRLAIIGDFTKYTSKSLQDFIKESNKYGHINFVNSLEEAKEKIIRK
jgi:ABC-type uncharacterized transport system auxiliary subunit